MSNRARRLALARGNRGNASRGENFLPEVRSLRAVPAAAAVPAGTRADTPLIGTEERRRLLGLVKRFRRPEGGQLRRLARGVTRILGVRSVIAMRPAGECWSRAAIAWPAGSAPARWDELPPTLEPGGPDQAEIVTCQSARHTWTIVPLPDRLDCAVVLLLEGDWTLSAGSLRLFAQLLRPQPPASSPHLQLRAALSAQRLAERLCGLARVEAVADVIFDSVARVVPSRFATLAVMNERGELTVVGTRGYPLEVASRSSIEPGAGALGVVLESASPLLVPDVSQFPELCRDRARYRTGAFVAVPLRNGDAVVGALCLTDRVGGGAFTSSDLAMLEALSVPAALGVRLLHASRQAERCARAAIVDSVSGLSNRRHLRDRLAEELARARRHRAPLALMMVDIDDFKGVNDRFGHTMGDRVIKAVADVLRQSVRRFDVCARFGGDEFAMVMPGSGADKAEAVAERIRQRIERLRIFDGAAGRELRVTASIGLALSHQSTPNDLIRRADEALYRSKREGKNRISAWTPDADSAKASAS